MTITGPKGGWRSVEWQQTRGELERVLSADFAADAVASCILLPSMPALRIPLSTATDQKAALAAAFAEILPEIDDDLDRKALRILTGAEPEFRSAPFKQRRLSAVLATGRDGRAQYPRGNARSVVDEWLDQLTSLLLADDAQLRAANYDERSDGSYTVSRWSRTRRLTPDRLIVTERPRVASGDAPTWFAPGEIAQEVERARAAGHEGEVAHVVEWRLDTRESSASQSFHVTLERIDYAEAFATYQLLQAHPELAERIDSYFDGTRPLRDFAPASPPAVLWANIAVLDVDNHLLAMKRSQSVSTFADHHTVGITEGMKLAEHPTEENPRDRDWFALIERGLRVELGLQADDYGPIFISWAGHFRPHLAFHIVGVVRTNLSHREIEEHIGRDADDIHEHALTRPDWIPLSDGVQVADILSSRDETDSFGRKWTPTSRLVLSEAARVGELV